MSLGLAHAARGGAPFERSPPSPSPGDPPSEHPKIQKVRIPHKKITPNRAPFPWFFVRVANGKRRYSLLFISCGEYGQSSSRLPKYGRFPPRQMALNGLSTALVFATYSSSSDPKKGHRNANMRPGISDGDP
jgi:hypothetical protein